jgi:hypothetical protein
MFFAKTHNSPAQIESHLMTPLPVFLIYHLYERKMPISKLWQKKTVLKTQFFN